MTLLTLSPILPVAGSTARKESSWDPVLLNTDTVEGTEGKSRVL